MAWYGYFLESPIIHDFLHLSLSTRRPAHSVERAVLTDNTRILPIASLQCKNKWRINWDHSYATESNVRLARYKCTCSYNHNTKNEIEINNISKQVITLYNTSGIEKLPICLFSWASYMVSCLMGQGTGKISSLQTIVRHACNGPEWKKYEICLSIEHAKAYTWYNYQVSNMTSRISGHFCIFGLVFFVLKSLVRIARQWSHVKFAILALKPRSHVRITCIFNV